METENILNSTSNFLAGKSRPTVEIGLDLYTIGSTLLGLLAVAIIAGVIIKKV